MKAKNKPIIPIVLLVAIVGGVGYFQTLAPATGTADELFELEMQQKKKAEEAAMDKKADDPLSKSRSAPSLTEIARNARPENMNSIKQKKTEKSKVALIWNTNPKPTKESPNDAATWNSWFRDQSGRAKNDKGTNTSSSQTVTSGGPASSGN